MDDFLDRLDLSLTSLFAGLALAEEVQRRMAAEGFADARFGHGFVFQHLIAGPLPIGDLARAMDVTQQRASKATAELEALGYVRREPDPADARVRRIALTARGGGRSRRRAARGRAWSRSCGRGWAPSGSTPRRSCCATCCARPAPTPR